MSGRYEQLGRQLRKVRTSLAKHDPAAVAVALRRATHLASDLVLEHADAEDVAGALAALAQRTIVDASLEDRLARRFAAAEDREHTPDEAEATEAGRDLDRLLRSLEHGASMPELAFGPLVAAEVPAAESRVALTVSGRHVVIAGRGGEGLVFIDDRPVGRPFAMVSPPTSKAEVQREVSGMTRIVWEPEKLTIEVGPDFASARRVD